MKPQTFIAWREAFGGRRFLLTLGAGVVNTLLRIWNYIDISSYVTLTIATVGAYIAAGTYQKVKSNVEVNHDPERGNSSAISASGSSVGTAKIDKSRTPTAEGSGRGVADDPDQ